MRHFEYAIYPTIGSILGIAGIVATIIVGITIFLMQRRADRRINELTKELHRIIHHEDERKKSIKRYFIRRINSDYKRINKYHNELKQHIQQYLEDRSDEESWDKLKRFIDNFFVQRVDSFATVTEDVKPIVHVLDNPRLIDKFGLIALFSGQLKGYARDLGKHNYRSNQDIINIQNEIDSTMDSINEYWDLLMKEVDNKLD